MNVKRSYLFFLLLASFVVRAQEGSYVAVDRGILVHPGMAYPGTPQRVELTVLTPSIIRVRAAVADFSADTSLSVLAIQRPAVKFKFVRSAQSVVLVTEALRADVDLNTGAVSFYDASGKILLREKTFGRSLQPQVYEGQNFYRVRQVFETTDDDAWYGLGQHQDGLMDYRSYGVQLFQNNTEVAIPFLFSKKNYGLLWDNASLTQAGDLRTYQDLDGLQLHAKDGTPGWLTATYFNNKDSIVTERPESSIRYEYLNDSKLLLPSVFDPAKGKVTWSGTVSSNIVGLHRLRCTYAGYVRVWIDDTLVLDRWRQAWNPGSAFLDLRLQKNRQRQLRIEWRPDGGESYLSFKYLPPQTAEENNEFGFASEAGRQLDYYFVSGRNADSVISGYRQLTGKASLLPRWAFGKWQSRERYRTAVEILDVVDSFRRRGLPLDNIVLDWSYWKENDWGSQKFDATRFPDPAAMIKTLHDRYHVHFMISVWPKFYEGIDTYRQFNDSGWIYRRNIADRQRDWIGAGYVSSFYDAFNPAARRAFWSLLNRELYGKGVDAWWLDASEPDILSNVSPQKRIALMSPTALGPATAYLNAYPLEQVRGIAEGQLAADSGRRVFILTRSAFAGSQRYGAAVWSGDIASRWHDLQAQVPAGINFSLSGLPYWTMDIGGFAVEANKERAQGDSLEAWRELMTRWYQFGAFVPIFRVHGQYPYREIFNIAPSDHPAYQSMLYYDRLRYRLMAYIYAVAGAVYHHDLTMMRGLVMDFPSDTAVTKIGDEYLFGPSLLVCPVTAPGVRTKDIYLPEGQGWYDLYTGRYFTGGQHLKADAPYGRIPVLIREGSILPFGPAIQYTGERPADTLNIFVYTGRDAVFDLYEDDGLDRKYEHGAFSNIRMDYRENTGTLTIQAREGNFAGMRKDRVFRIVWVSKTQPATLDFDREDAVVHYSGKKQTITKL
jgi:alpha-D-xyloside xylohydrolase